MTEEVGKAVAEGEGFAGEVGGVIGIAGGAVVAEVADFEDVGVDATGFAVPAGRGIVEGHCHDGSTEIFVCHSLYSLSPNNPFLNLHT